MAESPRRDYPRLGFLCEGSVLCLGPRPLWGILRFDWLLAARFIVLIGGEGMAYFSLLVYEDGSLVKWATSSTCKANLLYCGERTHVSDTADFMQICQTRLI